MPDQFRLLPRLTCPHCWTAFAAEDVLWITSHADLRGDPRLGPDQQQRFLPSRFTFEGDAIDSKGFGCTGLACPNCHLSIPRLLLEMEPYFISILGTPSCGKSFYLAALIWELRRLLPTFFGLSFGDADPSANVLLSEYEKSLFLSAKGEQPVALGNLIRKTELQGELYDTVTYGNQSISYPRPFMFWIKPNDKHPNVNAQHLLNRVLVLYDNAGEHCLPGQETVAAPATQHLARSRLLMYLFDPTQDARFRKLCRGPTITGEAVVSRQDSVLHEAADRIRKYRRLSANTKYDRPLSFVVTKFDAWCHLLKDSAHSEPWVNAPTLNRLDRGTIEQRSAEVRQLLASTCPEVVAAAEEFANEVRYTPVSALGASPIAHPETGKPAIRPSDIKPSWVTVPLLMSLQEDIRGMISRLKKSNDGAANNHVVPYTPSQRTTAMPS